MNNLRVRFYKPEDYKQVKTILTEAKLYYPELDSKKHLSNVIKHDPESILVVLDKNLIVGTISVQYGRIPLLFRLAVLKNYRRQGIGTRLLKSATNILLKKGSKEIGFLVDDKNEDLKAFYTKLGWKNGNAFRWFYKDSIIP